MNRISLVILTLLFTLFSPAKAEVIDGPANFRVKPNGQILFSLMDGIKVECMPLENNWFEVSFTITLTKSQYDNQYEIKQGDKLYDKKGNVIATALADVPLKLTESYTYGGAPGVPKVYEMEIRGFVSQSNIKQTSIPENALNAIINNNTSKLTYSKLREFIVSQGFEKGGVIEKVYPKLNDYVIEESSVNGGSVTDRIDLIFEGDELILIVHSRPLKIKKIKDYRIDGYDLRLAVLRPPFEESVKIFLKKYKEAYNGAG